MLKSPATDTSRFCRRLLLLLLLVLLGAASSSWGVAELRRGAGAREGAGRWVAAVAPWDLCIASGWAARSASGAENPRLGLTQLTGA